jgi:hypothetical protein
VLVRGLGRFLELKDMARQQAEAKAALEAKVFLTQPKEPQAPFTTPQPFKLGPTVPSGGEPGGQRWGTSATVRRGWGGVGWGKMGWELGLPSTRSRELQLCNEELSACTCVWRVCQGTAGCVGATSPKDTCFARARLSACASAHVYAIQRSRSPPPPNTHTHTHTHTLLRQLSQHTPLTLWCHAQVMKGVGAGQCGRLRRQLWGSAPSSPASTHTTGPGSSAWQSCWHDTRPLVLLLHTTQVIGHTTRLVQQQQVLQH